MASKELGSDREEGGEGVRQAAKAVEKRMRRTTSWDRGSVNKGKHKGEQQNEEK